MIDYEKLKIAHELAFKFKPANRLKITYIYTNNGEMYYHLSLEPASPNYEFASIDELIEKLQGLTKHEPKYKVGWYLLHGHIRHTKFHDGDGFSMCEATSPECAGLILFPSRQALIEHQLNYWSRLLQDEEWHLSKELKSDGKFDCDDCGAVGITPDIQSNQSQVDVDGCQHSTNGNIYIIDGFNGSKESFKCIKCGEFYK